MCEHVRCACSNGASRDGPWRARVLPANPSARLRLQMRSSGLGQKALTRSDQMARPQAKVI